jgi:hypothetical protein
MSACIQLAPLTPTRSAALPLKLAHWPTLARPTPNATAERRACVAGARPRRVHLALRVVALGRSLDRDDPVRLEVVDPRRALLAPGGPRAARHPGDGYGETHVDAAGAPPSHGQTQRWPAPSGQARVSGQRRRVDPASAWARQWVLRDPAAVRRAQRFMAGPGATGRPGPLPHHRVRARLHRGRGRRQPPAALTAPRRPHRSDLRCRHDPRRYRADHRAGPPRLRIRRIERRSLASAFAWLRASRQSTTRRLLRTRGGPRLLSDRPPPRCPNCCEKWSTRARAPATASRGTTGARASTRRRPARSGSRQTAKRASGVTPGRRCRSQRLPSRVRSRRPVGRSRSSVRECGTRRPWGWAADRSKPDPAAVGQDRLSSGDATGPTGLDSRWA